MLTLFVYLTTFMSGLMMYWWSSTGFMNCFAKLYFTVLTVIGTYLIFEHPAISIMTSSYGG